MANILELFILAVTSACLGAISSNKYDGSKQDLVALPTDIPNDTEVLHLEYNKLATAPLADLEDFDLITLNLSANGFTTFPDLSDIGSTLEQLSLRDNKLNTIPKSILRKLVVLEDLDISSNKFIAFPDLTPVGNTLLYLNMENNSLQSIDVTDVEPLDKLLNLTLNLNKELNVVDLSPLNDTLVTLDVSRTQISVHGLFRNLTNLTHLMADIGQETEFPDLSNACEALRTIQMGAHDLQNIKSSFIDSCTVVESLSLMMSQLTEFPNITAMGNTLKILLLSGNQISKMDQNFLRAQTALEIIDLEENELTEFPDISNCGNTLMLIMLANNKIKTIDQAVSASLTSLLTFDLSNNELDEFPDLTGSNSTLTKLDLHTNHISKIDSSRLSPLTKLETLYLQDNHLTSIPDVPMPALKTLSLNENRFSSLPSFTNLGNSLQELYLNNNNISSVRSDYFIGLENLLILDMASTKLTSLPDLRLLDNLQILLLSNTPIRTASPTAVFRLGKLTAVFLDNTELMEIPTMCPESSLTLYLENNSHLDLCSSKMAWLKQSFFTVTYTNVMCDSIGKMWSDATFEELLAVPSVPQLGDVKQLFIGLNVTDTVCRWPTSGILPSMTWHDCLFSCLDADGCSSFNHNQDKQWCALVVPTSGQENPMEEYEDGWDLYV